MNILGQKRNAVYKIYKYGPYTNLSQTICHNLSADSRIMSSWVCPSRHCYWTKLIEHMIHTVVSISTSRHLNVHGLMSQFVGNDS